MLVLLGLGLPVRMSQVALTLANQAQVADLGMSVNEILGKTDRELGTSEEFIERATAHDRLVFETGEDLIVEGVETQEQLQFFKQHDCQLIQGWYYSTTLS